MALEHAIIAGVACTLAAQLQEIPRGQHMPADHGVGASPNARIAAGELVVHDRMPLKSSLHDPRG